MVTMTYYVALAFMRSEEGEIVACEPKETGNSDQSYGGDGGALRAIAFSRTGDPPVEIRWVSRSSLAPRRELAAPLQ